MCEPGEYEPKAESDALTEWGARMPDGRVETCPSEPFARRFAQNDPARVVVQRTVTPWMDAGAPREPS
jgi:hypothetical protein